MCVNESNGNIFLNLAMAPRDISFGENMKINLNINPICNRIEW